MYDEGLSGLIQRMPDSRWKTHMSEIVKNLTGRKKWEALRYPEQTPPSDSLWEIWIFAAGRGSGKTRTGAEETKEFAENNPGSRLLLVGRTGADTRESLIEGESGILALYEQGDPNTPTYKPSIRRLEWPNGAVAFCTSAEEPDSLRGVQAHFAWADEVASWHRPKKKKKERKMSAWDNLRIATRLGTTPRIIVTTTPRKTKMLKVLHKELKVRPLFLRLSTADTRRNSRNLHPSYVRLLTEQYEGTGCEAAELRGDWPWPL